MSVDRLTALALSTPCYPDKVVNLFAKLRVQLSGVLLSF